MGSKGTSTGLKRKPAPEFWPIHRKEVTWVVKPSSGPHRGESCMPLVLVLRESLGYAQTRKEAKTMVSQGKISVDGRIRKEDDFPAGLADVISIPDIDKNFCVLPSAKGLVLQPIDKEQAKSKLCRIENKKVLRNGNVQLNLHDGSNIFVKVADPKNPQEDTYETLDTVKISLPDKQIIETVKMKEKASAIITGGKNVGKYGRIAEIEKVEGKNVGTLLQRLKTRKATAIKRS